MSSVSGGGKLANAFKQHDRYRRRQVQASSTCGHGDGVAIRRPFSQQTFGQTLCFASKNQTIAPIETDLPIWTPRFGREKKRTTGSFGLKFAEVFPQRHIDVPPIIHACPPQLTIVEAESQRLNQVKPAAGREREPCNIPGVWRDLRFDQYKIKHTPKNKKSASRLEALFPSGGNFVCRLLI